MTSCPAGGSPPRACCRDLSAVVPWWWSQASALGMCAIILSGALFALTFILRSAYTDPRSTVERGRT